MSWLGRIFFNFWYYFKPPWDSGISPPELMDFIENNPPGRAIDLGCGTGTNLITLAQHGWQVVGVDFAPRAVQLARRKLRAHSIQADVRVADVTRLDGIQGPFELGLDLGCFHSLNLDQQRAYLDNLDRLLVPGGSWLMYGFFKTDPTDSGPGLTDLSIKQIEGRLEPVDRKDGTDRRERHSAWFHFKKP